MAENSRLLVVSNRLPVSLVHEGNDWKTERSVGGLATAMDPILKRAGGVWIGWSGTPGEVPAEALAQLRQEQACLGVDLPADLLARGLGDYAPAPGAVNEPRNDPPATR